MTLKKFELVSSFSPQGDQNHAIKTLTKRIKQNEKHQILHGVTGSGKTFTMANVIVNVQKKTLVLAHNKTLAAQLYQEFKAFFPNNAVEFFVSYYDYYQPEAYIASSDTYIEKDAQINDAIDRMRLSATRSLLSRNDVIIVASVSCIYGIGSVEAYQKMRTNLHVGQILDRDELLQSLIAIQYSRNDIDFQRGKFRVRGDIVDIFPAYEAKTALRIEFFGDEIESIHQLDPLRGRIGKSFDKTEIYPGSLYAITPKRRNAALKSIKIELKDRLQILRNEMRLVEAQRLEQRVTFDLEMLEIMGYCNGVENYSRHFTGQNEGEPPPCLLDYFGENWLIFADESHVSIPQVKAMYLGDRSRKQNLVSFGFRLPSALDNRPLKFSEFEERINQVVYVSATPGDYELDQTQGIIVEQIIRPTGLLDPVIEVRPANTQVDDLIDELRERVDRMGHRVLVTTLTKRMAEELTEYMLELNIRAKYLHSDIDTLERIALIAALRAGDFDVLIGINLLREGLDLPEVSLIAILDADKEGFLRSKRALIQTAGRGARNVDGKVLMYANKITKSMQACIDETQRRRDIQMAHNKKHAITPKTINKPIFKLDSLKKAASNTKKSSKKISKKESELEIARLRKEMFAAAKELAFERAAILRDMIHQLEQEALGIS